MSSGLAAKSVREPAEPGDGDRFLVDRLWPRGVSKQRAHLTGWMKELAPSTELRQWFGHDPDRWDEFQRRYWSELKERHALDTLRELGTRAQRHRITLVFGAGDREHNDAMALLSFARRM